MANIVVKDRAFLKTYCRNMSYETLIQACKDGELAKVTQAVTDGADLNKKNPDNQTPLYIAVANKHKPIVEYLLSKGANISEKNGEYGSSALHKACASGALDIAKVLVNAGADVNLKSDEGYTPLSNAVSNNKQITVKYLISNGANIGEKNGKLGVSVLHKACMNGNLEIAKILVDAGADVNFKSDEGFTPLYVAVQKNHISIVEYLLTKGVSIDEKNGKKLSTALSKACSDGLLNIVKMLVNAGANIHIKNALGKTPIMIASLYNHLPVVEYLKSLEPGVYWNGFTQSDISKFDTIFETKAPAAGQLPPAVNYSCCPVCLKFVERSEACMYMRHKCTDYYHKNLHEKYANPEGLIYWCTICGRICMGHRHYEKASWESNEPELLPSGAPFDNDCKKTNGGGGVEEKLARFRALRNTAYELQAALDANELITVQEAMNELVQQCWNASPGFITKRIMTQKKWNRPTTNFPPNALLAVEPAFVYTKNDPGAYEVPRILKPGNANFGPNSFTYDDSEPVIQFKHKKADGTMYAHPLLNKETLLMFIGSSGSDWPCFDPTCGGHLWPAEVIQALENPALAATEEEKAKGQAYKERVHGPPQAVGGHQRRKTRRRHRR